MRPLRLISYNMFKGRLWWSGRSALAEMATALRTQAPDILFLQEFRGSYGDSRAIHAEFQSALGMPHGYYGKNFTSERSDHGNAIYANPELLESGNMDLTLSKRERRGLLTARCQPWGKEKTLYLFCTHLDLGEKNRLRQLDKVCTEIERILPGPDSPFILAGDFNDWKHTADQYLLDRLDLRDAFRKQSGALARSFPSFYPLLDLDRVYVHGLEVRSANVLADNFRMLSDHLPLSVEVVSAGKN